ncbi:hypothetical protein [Cupriavidus taiwanensis]|uniref:Immunity protein 72 domain-containing protein n=1 Tax=Cupriavidus taiwanensis (strain DSM 17343 / BCRC 17206 / CCUG 44338 / CIP 107171 / LMG 19424 / R1) TaxID=977880 RepID=B3R9P0_CUPTR|nr:hypothetical protein [Cupriavidus taiwanensis]CAQ71615.1 conserved hypothetical protein [Cupriavidus taiwanensis LMG 19424]
MSRSNFRPYDIPRNLDQDAWFLYQTTSPSYYESCAQLSVEFAELYNRFITDHGRHGAGRLDYWVSRYFAHADNIRRGIKLIQVGDDYMPMADILDAAASDYRGLVEQPLEWMTEEQRERWNESFNRLSGACTIGATTLRNNEWSGRNWLERDLHRHEYELVDRDNGHTGDLKDYIQSLTQRGLLAPPTTYPHHPVKTNVRAKAGEPCPQTGVWVPAQWLHGAKDFSLAFCVRGRLMQPAFQLHWGKPYDIWAEFPLPDEDPEDRLITPLKTTAVDTVWHFVARPAVQPAAAEAPHLRCQSSQSCPKSGYWMTPAKANSRRYFHQGDTMPEVVSDYGTTIWQWDTDQSDPKL